MVIFCDVDGTLFEGEYGINSENLQFVNNSGDHRFVLVTGRNYSQAMQFKKDNGVNMNLDIIGGNGSFMKRNRHQLEVNQKMDKQLIVEIISFLNDIKAPYIIHTPDKNIKDKVISIDEIIIEAIKSHIAVEDKERFEEAVAKYGKMFREEIKEIDDIKSYILEEDIDIIKIEVISNNKEILETVNNKYKNHEHLCTEKSYENNIDIHAKGTSKGNGILKYLKEEFGYKVPETISIGNNYNDQSMFRVTDFSFAVSNAVPNLEEVTYLQSSCKDFFIAEVFDKVVKKL